MVLHRSYRRSVPAGCILCTPPMGSVVAGVALYVLGVIGGGVLGDAFWPRSVCGIRLRVFSCRRIWGGWRRYNWRVCRWARKVSFTKRAAKFISLMGYALDARCEYRPLPDLETLILPLSREHAILPYMKIYTVTFSFGIMAVDVLVDAPNRKEARRQAVAAGKANALTLVSFFNETFLPSPFGGIGGARISSPRFCAAAIADVREHTEFV